MPELPEVTTTVRGLQRVLPGLVITDVWTDLAKKNTLAQFQKTIKNELFFKKFKKEVVGAKVLHVERRAKNILINLFNKNTILIHLKMTGHLLFGEYIQKKDKSWEPKNKTGPLGDPYNRFVHFVFSLSNGKHLAFSDARKFGKITIEKTDAIHKSLHLGHLGPEPLDKNFTFPKFKERLFTKPKGNIKTVLMDQAVISGVGNIYSDEMLWLASIHPESKPENIPVRQLQILFDKMKEVLNKGIDFGGDSTSDYRDIDGKRGRFQAEHNAYRKAKEPCGKRGCKGVIIRKVINGRSAHFCNKHQVLF